MNHCTFVVCAVLMYVQTNLEILMQPQEGFGQVENEIGFDGYGFDDLPRVT